MSSEPTGRLDEVENVNATASQRTSPEISSSARVKLRRNMVDLGVPEDVVNRNFPDEVPRAPIYEKLRGLLEFVEVTVNISLAPPIWRKKTRETGSPGR